MRPLINIRLYTVNFKFKLEIINNINLTLFGRLLYSVVFLYNIHKTFLLYCMFFILMLAQLKFFQTINSNDFLSSINLMLNYYFIFIFYDDDCQNRLYN